MVGDCSKLYREHPDWILHALNGDPVVLWQQYNEPKSWGYRDSDYFVLDTSHPEAMAYLSHVFRTLRGMSFTLFKTDFLFWGCQDSAKVRRYAPGKTSVQYFRNAMAVIRQAIGEDARWLECISPFMSMIGYADMMRIAHDCGAKWEANTFGPVNMIEESTADQYFNGVYWQNDPDAMILRNFHVHLTYEQQEALALLQAMSGGCVNTSDPIHLLSDDRRRLLTLVRPDGVIPAEYPFWQEKRDELVLITRKGRSANLLIFNPTDREITRVYDWSGLLSGTIYLRRLHGASQLLQAAEAITVPPRSGILYFASANELEKEPDNLWNWMTL